MRIADTASIQYPGENDDTRLAQDSARDVGQLCLAAMMAQDLEALILARLLNGKKQSSEQTGIFLPAAAA
ncbi:hypothetical protein [Chromobacterium amazonense]|uniref:Uncharacterized protein n=1 Tax=Chromobacterium amazonense TaxID=1382803 RepID=A0A2S9X1R9_9NEIS|nr:hypothetical protein [Chromobacterium amazonense]MDE1714894.1 hypothetical protein [Chromobacterium amazonense]PRP69669.1 hypothetical protein BUE93_15730 [Chromobacterium amazonense]